MHPAASRVLIPELDHKRKQAMEELADLASSGYLYVLFSLLVLKYPTTRLDAKMPLPILDQNANACSSCL